MLEENKAVIRKYYESIDKGDFDTVKGLLADDFGSDFMGQVWTIESYMQMGQRFRASFPDLHHKLEAEVAEGDTVVTPLVAGGTQKAEFMGLPASGKSFETRAITVYRVSNGKIAFHSAVLDMMTMMQQLGAIPT